MHILLKMISVLLFSCKLFSMDKANLDDPQVLLSKLSLRQKIAQLCVVAAVSNEEKHEDLLKRWQEWQHFIA